MASEPDFYAMRLGDYPDGYRMSFVCRRCGFVGGKPFTELIAAVGADATVGAVAARSRCTFQRYDIQTGQRLPPCGGRADLSPGPEPGPPRVITKDPVLPRYPDIP